MFQFMLVVGLVLAYYGYAVTKNPRIWGDQGRDAIKEENWNRYVRYNGQFAMYAGFLMAALDALDMAVDLSTAIYLLILLAAAGGAGCHLRALAGVGQTSRTQRPGAAFYRAAGRNLDKLDLDVERE